MAHIVPHWNWPDRVGKVTPVHVFTSGDEGELFLNGRSLGRQKKDPANWKKAYRLSWDDVVYEPGTLKVVTFKKGAPWAEATVSTTGPAAQLKLEVEKGLDEDSDLAFVNLEVQDAEGRFVPDAAVEVTFAVKGPCELVATDNGDETDFTSFHSPTRQTFSGRLQAILRKSPNSSGTITLTASSPNLKTASTSF
jgi:beta-galactosidase